MKNNREGKFYPNVEYNRKKRTKYLVLSAVAILLSLAFAAWMVSSGNYFGLIMLAIVVFAVVLLPKAFKENPVRRFVVLDVNEKEVDVAGKLISRSDITSVKAIVYLGSVGNSLENRKFIEEAAISRPPSNMTGSIEIAYKVNGKVQYEFAVIEDVVEALALFVNDAKVQYGLGYSLGKDYRVSLYNLKAFFNEEENANETSSKDKMKQLI